MSKIKISFELSFELEEEIIDNIAVDVLINELLGKKVSLEDIIKRNVVNKDDTIYYNVPLYEYILDSYIYKAKKKSDVIERSKDKYNIEQFLFFYRGYY